jgi:hypothetical protein
MANINGAVTVVTGGIKPEVPAMRRKERAEKDHQSTPF